MRLRPGFVGKFCLTAEDNVELRQRQIVALVLNLNHLSERCTRSVDVQWFPHCTLRSSLLVQLGFCSAAIPITLLLILCRGYLCKTGFKPFHTVSKRLFLQPDTRKFKK